MSNTNSATTPVAADLTVGVRNDTDPATWELAEGLRDRLKRNDAGLVPAIVQDSATGKVLMMAWMDDHALAYTIGTRRGTYWSRSRGEYWIKGMTSGHFQYVDHIALDCDHDTVLLQVQQTGAACHTGAQSCFDVDPLG
ncbi:phosphoribosyl-AMP cyclohydrolase [Corynebacterium sp. TAE3-ERU12]|uniref:phosphoribosyl-AMP cyclohydrolase n=1 Tax=Corynebacterium sp. TAE3-ERU12 TaxID=2849491 RepID=UPI001C437DD0|nr:phosphoribosyl-AMP cyclohydrolase [Corynebacterium sp. TAE3-ERU12]MBV7296168.1 phosphoribosyl-AMP cyclohydrolase [Corynebacterium sp. TAE3-ERU12]